MTFQERKKLFSVRYRRTYVLDNNIELQNFNSEYLPNTTQVLNFNYVFIDFTALN